MPWYDVIHLDRLFVNLSGTYDSSNTTWTLPFADSTVDTVVLGDGHGALSGQILTIDTISGKNVTVNGNDYTASDVVVGRAFAATAELTRPYVRNRNGNADVDAELTIQRVSAIYKNTGGLQIRSTQPNRTDRKRVLDTNPIDGRGKLTHWASGRSEDMRTFIENLTPKPSIVSSIEWVVEYAPRILE